MTETTRAADWRSFRRSLRVAIVLILTLAATLPTMATASPALRADTPDFTGQHAVVLGAPSVRLRGCAAFTCETAGGLRLGDGVIVTGPEENGFLPVQATESGATGYAWALYISVDGQPAPWFQQGEAGCKRVALIFDIGVGDSFDYGILDTLKTWQTPATFFAMGWTTRQDPATVQAIADAGFPIGLHGDQRVDLTTLGDSQIAADLQQAQDAIQPIAGDNWIPYATPYAAATNERVRTITAEQGLMPVGWTLPADDYDMTADPNAIWNRVVPKVADGDIIEMHIDAPNTAASTGVALPWVIDALQKRGYQFVTVPNLTLPCGVTTASLDGTSSAQRGTPAPDTTSATASDASGNSTASDDTGDGANHPDSRGPVEPSHPSHPSPSSPGPSASSAAVARDAHR